MDYDYGQRSFLLPEGCKDLLDVIQSKTVITARGFEITVQLSVLKGSDIQIFAEGNTLRIITGPSSGRAIQVPNEYPLAGARAVYLNGRLRIVIPKSGSKAAPDPD